MITEATVFILGAGASVPYGYPTGRGLRADIIECFLPRYNKLEGYEKADGKDSPLTRHLDRTAREIEKFKKIFKSSGIISIDKFLALNPIFGYYGKIAIVMSILTKEKESSFEEEIDPKYKDQDWLIFLYNEMIRNLNSPDSYTRFAENKVRFITFNYDRSLEYYIYSRFANSFTQERLYDRLNQPILEERKKLVPFEFIHIYGQVDRIPLEGGYEYSQDFDFETVTRLSKNIRVINEGVDENDENIQLAKEIISEWADRIFFLGFGFDPMNLEVLGIPKILSKDHRIFGTAFNASAKKIRDIQELLKTPKIKMSDELCLLSAYKECHFFRFYLDCGADFQNSSSPIFSRLNISF